MTDNSDITNSEAADGEGNNTLLQRLSALSPKKKLAGGAVVALSSAMIIGASLWLNTPTYSVLFSNIPEAEGGMIVERLKSQGVPYKLTNGGATILVPEANVHDLRLTLATEGLPKSALVGFEVMENQKLGASQFQEHVNYQRALEGELSRTIESLDALSAARVHLGIPKQTGFLRSNQQLTASVAITIRPGHTLTKDQIAGIVHLVSASVPKMDSDGVSVVDQHGNLLTKKADPLKDALNDGAHLRYAKEVESAVLERIERLLNPILGKGNYSAQVAATMDFDNVEETSETYRPNPANAQAIRSQQLSENSSERTDPVGVPGATSNRAPLLEGEPAGRGALSNGRTSIVNYEVDKTIRHIRHATGDLKKLSVAVVVNHRQIEEEVPVSPTSAEGTTDGGPDAEPAQPKTRLVSQAPSAEELSALGALVREAIGFDAARGDTLEVSSLRFAAPEIVVEPEVSFFDDPQNRAWLRDGLNYFVVLLGFALVYFGALRPLLRSVAPAPTKKRDDGRDDVSDAEKAVDAMVPGASFEMKLSLARELAKSDPKLVSGLIKKWAAEKTKE